MLHVLLTYSERQRPDLQILRPKDGTMRSSEHGQDMQAGGLSDDMGPGCRQRRAREVDKLQELRGRREKSLFNCICTLNSDQTQHEPFPVFGLHQHLRASFPNKLKRQSTIDNIFVIPETERVEDEMNCPYYCAQVLFNFPYTVSRIAALRSRIIHKQASHYPHYPYYPHYPPTISPLNHHKDCHPFMSVLRMLLLFKPIRYVTLDILAEGEG